jgi:acetyl-CoA carboxylase carboxyltransferase component
MAGQGFDPDFILSWPSGRMGVMEGESAIMAVHGTEIDKAKREKRALAAETAAGIERMRADYERDLDARHAAARGQVDAIVVPDETRAALAFLLRATSRYAGPHLGPFVLPPLDAVAPR